MSTTPSESGQSGDVTTLQREVQRLLGRCLLRLQQYEMLLKAFLASQEIAGTVHSAPIRQAERVEELRTATLGTLVKELLGEYVTEDGAAEEESVALDREVTVSGLPVIRVKMTMQMAPEHVGQTKVALQELVALRNSLVHHLLEAFNVWTVDGCVAAAEHLSQSYVRIDQRFEELREWAKHADEARKLSAQFMESPQFQDFLLYGVKPDGTIEWAIAGIVAALREALAAVGEGAWARLDKAVAWIGSERSDHTPERYGCVSWPQVLHESRAFQIEHRKSDDGRKATWFRERAARLSQGAQ